MTDQTDLTSRIAALSERADALISAHDYVAPATTSETVAARLRKGIKFGSYPPGTRLREVSLAEEFEVSRGPVREALQILVKEGLVTFEAHRGARVIQLDRQNLIEIFDVREALLGMVHRRAAENAHRFPEIVRLLREVLDLLEEAAALADDTAPFLDLRRQFGAIILHLAQNRRLAVLTDNLEQIVTTHPRFLTSTKRRAESLAMMRAMVDALSRGDAQAAEDSVRAAVRRAREDSLSLPDYSGNRN